MKIDELIPPDLLAQEIDAGYVSRKTHPTLPLAIYTYTRTAQYDSRWNTATIACRGLVADAGTGEIIARPFPKFFNHSEHEAGRPWAPPLPNEDFEVYDKVDGSLGILFHYQNQWHVASKGSFSSTQAEWAANWLSGRDLHWLDPALTYLTEIVYSTNRIVVHYDTSGLVLLGANNTATGANVSLETAAASWRRIGGEVVTSHPALPLTRLVELAADNRLADGRQVTGAQAEGLVIHYPVSDVRVKLKLSDYLRLHKILTGVTARDIWRALGVERHQGVDAKTLGRALKCSTEEAARLAALPTGAFNALLADTPDEFDRWARHLATALTRQADVLAEQMAAEFAARAGLAGDRAAFAKSAATVGDSIVRAELFRLLDGNGNDNAARLLTWQAVYPTAADAFAADDDQ